LIVEALAHAVELAALQALVELAALAEGAHDHIGGDGEQAQVFFGARRAAAEVPLDVLPNAWPGLRFLLISS